MTAPLMRLRVIFINKNHCRFWSGAKKRHKAERKTTTKPINTNVIKYIKTKAKLNLVTFVTHTFHDFITAIHDWVDCAKRKKRKTLVKGCSYIWPRKCIVELIVCIPFQKGMPIIGTVSSSYNKHCKRISIFVLV